MPLISEAYFKAKDEIVPQKILNLSGRILNLRQDEINQNKYNIMIQKLEEYLRQGDNLDRLNQQFLLDSFPNSQNEGHIDGIEQERILSAVYLDDYTLKDILDLAIQINYF